MGREQIVGLIIDECRKRHGEGQVFYRTDGLAFEERRAAKRAAYLREHPETRDEYRELIESAGVTPGMSRDETIAAWGLVREDLDNLVGRKTADEHDYYACWRGFNVGRPYVLYLIHNTVVGVREDPQGAFRKERAAEPREPTRPKRPEAEPPKELRGLDEELARAFYGYRNCGYTRDGRLVGTPHDFETLRLYVGCDDHLYHEIEYFTSLPDEFEKLERRIEELGGGGLYREALREAGLDTSTATLEQRARAALSIAGELRPAGETPAPPPTDL